MRHGSDRRATTSTDVRDERRLPRRDADRRPQHERQQEAGRRRRRRPGGPGGRRPPRRRPASSIRLAGVRRARAGSPWIRDRARELHAGACISRAGTARTRAGAAGGGGEGAARRAAHRRCARNPTTSMATVAGPRLRSSSPDADVEALGCDQGGEVRDRQHRRRQVGEEERDHRQDERVLAPAAGDLQVQRGEQHDRGVEVQHRGGRRGQQPPRPHPVDPVRHAAGHGVEEAEFAEQVGERHRRQEERQRRGEELAAGRRRWPRPRLYPGRSGGRRRRLPT